MRNLIRTEHQKLSHTLGKKLPFLVPLLNLLLAFVLTNGRGGALPAGAWNWWYTMLLPGMTAVFCYLCVKKDKRISYYHVFTLQISPEKSWVAKSIYCILVMAASNLVTFLGTWLGGKVFGTTVQPVNGLAGACLLSITCAWSIPLLLFLSDRFGMFASVFAGIALPLAAVFTVADGDLWWMAPFAIPVRLMCPVLGIMPNGLHVEPGSGLESRSVILPGVGLSVLWLVLMILLTSVWFKRKGERG